MEGALRLMRAAERNFAGHTIVWAVFIPAAAQQDGTAYTAVSKPVSEEERAVLEAGRPDELYTPVPRHIVPLPTPPRAATQLRTRLNHWYVISRLETPSSADGAAAHDGQETAPEDVTAGQHGGS